jgi:hypothetical protein
VTALASVNEAAAAMAALELRGPDLLTSVRLCGEQRLRAWREWMTRCWFVDFNHGDALNDLLVRYAAEPDTASASELLNDAVDAGWVVRLRFQPTLSQAAFGMCGVSGGADLRKAVKDYEAGLKAGDRNVFAGGYGYAPNRESAAARGFVTKGTGR